MQGFGSSTNLVQINRFEQRGLLSTTNLVQIDLNKGLTLVQFQFKQILTRVCMLQQKSSSNGFEQGLFALLQIIKFKQLDLNKLGLVQILQFKIDLNMQGFGLVQIQFKQMCEQGVFSSTNLVQIDLNQGLHALVQI